MIRPRNRCSAWRRRAFDVLLAELEEADRCLVHLKYFENRRYREIGEATGMSIGNVGYRLHHILKELAEKLRQMGIDGVS